ncbi:hypothetical protein PanWU01x14_268850 [Parasponia andersonii]|uniref:Putative plant transposon protein domain-containing protein n=1 Tax=Parasponia andersonii TaxID=3476 RepID=A0A2P5B5S0_PARAD|nr:hypothetical protein PanWU01x14_268850 [Parasponia andersonii]
MGIKQVARKASKAVKFESEAAEIRCHHLTQLATILRSSRGPDCASDNNTVYVREVQVPLSVEAINTIFGLGDPVDEHSEFVEDITEPELAMVLETVAIAGVEWNVSFQGAYIYLRSSLNPHAKVWYHFLKSHLLPTTHGKIVSKERVLLLYSMLTGKSINVGRMIHREICACAARKSRALFFPSLITRMCRNARAPYLYEEKLHNTGEIDAIAVTRIA